MRVMNWMTFENAVTAIGQMEERTMKRFCIVCAVVFATAVLHAQSAPHQAMPTSNPSQSAANIFRATLGEPNPKTPEISTEQLRQILADKSATVFDVRPHMEFSISHIPGVRNVAQKPGTTTAQYVSDVVEIGRLLNGNKAAPIVVYCNGPFCGKSKRVSDDLIAAGYSNVRRYQLGMPVWRALVGVSQIEPDGARYVMQNDRTAVWLDTRSPEQFQKGSLTGAKHIGMDVASGKDNPAMQKAQNDGTLPMQDHDTRIIAFGDDPTVSRSVAEAIAHQSFDNVTFFAGSYMELAAAVK
jgi:rhodanese-related sulfurtransferase